MRSRAVERVIQPGSLGSCMVCDKPVSFRARHRLTTIIANVYVKGRWDRVEHYHSDCYDEAGQPYGEPDRSQPLPMTFAQRKAKAMSVEDI